MTAYLYSLAARNVKCHASSLSCTGLVANIKTVSNVSNIRRRSLHTEPLPVSELEAKLKQRQYANTKHFSLSGTGPQMV